MFFNGIIKYKKKILLYLIQFYTGFLRQSRHLQIEVGGGCHLKQSHLKQKTKKIIVQYARGFVPN